MVLETYTYSRLLQKKFDVSDLSNRRMNYTELGTPYCRSEYTQWQYIRMEVARPYATSQVQRDVRTEYMVHVPHGPNSLG